MSNDDVYRVIMGKLEEIEQMIRRLPASQLEPDPENPLDATTTWPKDETNLTWPDAEVDEAWGTLKGVQVRPGPDDRYFPILVPPALHAIVVKRVVARRVPWEMLENFEPRAILNHKQTLDRLAERGGLSPSELLAILENRPWQKIGELDALSKIQFLITDWIKRKDESLYGEGKE